ncbi:hypothetical protein V1525DRAFT_392312 [Lipomyces kononenkoae]|uniref:Uncharacterized protein n=1 Tax=Lipomyces kononenkoae TaxID=34357 RepID=A0ACC3TB70_LIPKO
MDRSPLEIALDHTRHHPLALHPKPPPVHAMPDFRGILTRRPYSPASLDAYRLRSSSSSSSSSLPATAPPVVTPASSSPTSSPPRSSSEPSLPPISSILAGTVDAPRSQSWSASLPPASHLHSHTSPTSAAVPIPILTTSSSSNKDTPASSLANSPALSSVFSLAGSPYSVASDLPPCSLSSSSSSLSSHESDYGYFYKRPTSPTPTPALPPEAGCQTDGPIDNDSRPAAYNSYYCPVRNSLPPPPVVGSPRSHQSDSAGSPTPSTGGPDRYACPMCSRAFSRPSSLRIHTHSHTGEKPFVCGHHGCGKAFSVRSNMKRHERGCHAV